MVQIRLPKGPVELVIRQLLCPSRIPGRVSTLSIQDLKERRPDLPRGRLACERSQPRPTGTAGQWPACRTRRQGWLEPSREGVSHEIFTISSFFASQKEKTFFWSPCKDAPEGHHLVCTTWNPNHQKFAAQGRPGVPGSRR